MIAGICLIACLAGPAPAPEGPQGVVAVVNGKAITYGYFMKRTGPYLESVPRAQREEVLRRELVSLIEGRVLLDLAKREGIQASEAEIDARVRQLIQYERRTKKVNIADVEDYYRTIRERQGLTRREWRQHIREELLILKLYRAKVFLPTLFSAEELRSYYRNNPERFLKGGRLIFRQIRVPRNLEGREEILKAIEAGIRAGVPFPTLVRRYSIGPRRNEGGLWMAVYGKPAGGGGKQDASTLAVASMQSLRKPLREALEALKPGETSGRIELPAATHIIRVEKVEKPVRMSFEEAQPAIREALKVQYWEERRKEFVRRAVERAEIRRFR